MISFCELGGQAKLRKARKNKSEATDVTIL